MHGGKELVSGWQEMMDRDRGNGTLNESVGCHACEWPGNPDAQMEDLAQEVKGMAQKNWSHVKTAVHDEFRNEQKETAPASR